MHWKGLTSASLFLLAVAMMILAVGAVASFYGGDEAEGGRIRSISLGNNENNVNEAVPGPLARRVVQLKVAPQVSDDELRGVCAAVVERAKQGDVEAAAFVFEVARLQRAALQAQSAAGR